MYRLKSSGRLEWGVRDCPWIASEIILWSKLKGCRPCRRPLTEETAKLGADGRNSGLVTDDKFRGYSNPFVLMLSQVDQFLPANSGAGKMPKRRFWNPLKRKKYSAQTMRNRSQKTAETLLLEPTKNKEKACKPPGQTQEKGVWDAHAKRQNPSRFCAQAIAKPQPEKCRNVAFGTH